MSLFVWIPALPILAICVVGLVLIPGKLGSYPRALRFAQVGFVLLILRATGIAFLALAAVADRPAVS